MDSPRGQGFSWEALAAWLAAGLGRWAWRNRYEIGPGGAALAVFVIGAVIHSVSPAWALAVPPFGLLATLGGWGTLLRWGHAHAAWSVGIAGTLWVTGLVEFGPTNPAVLIALAAVLAPAWTVWWRYVHPRPRVHIAGGSRLPWKWEAYRFRRAVWTHLREIIREWPETAANASVPGSTIRKAEADEVSYRLHIDLRPGQTMDDLVANRGRIESALGSKRNRVRIASDQFADRVVLTWALGDPLSGIAKWEGPTSATVTEPITIATYQDGQPLSVRFSEPLHWLVTGMTGMGKSSLMDLLVASFAACRDAVIWACDPEGGVSMGKWESVLGWLSDQGSALDMLNAVLKVHHVRLAVMRAAGVSDWTADLGPFLFVILDEFPVLPNKAKAAATEIATRCRKTGVRLFVLAQVGAADQTGGSTTLRGQLGGVVAFKLKEIKHADFAFPTERVAGWDPMVLEQKGEVLVKSPSHREPVPARTLLVDADTARVWANKLATDERPVIELPSGHQRFTVVSTDDEPELDDVEPDEAEDDEEPEGAAESASREERILDAIRAAGERIPGREVARRAGLPHAKVIGTDLPELERRGLVAHEREGSAKLWGLVAWREEG